MPLIRKTEYSNSPLTLENCFKVQEMCNAWKHHIRRGLRQLDFVDLHDNYDFDINHRSIIETTRINILSNQYIPKAPFSLMSEKKLGVCRHLQIPTVIDAIVLQCIHESMASLVQTSQPSDRAYYNRRVKIPKNEADIDESFPYDWFELWKKFQEKIYEFTNTFDYVVVTDITNYYDNISFARLRNVISGMGHFDETMLDFIFKVFESLVWRPDYVPFPGHGLPQINLDAPRLLGHAFLFEIDVYLAQKTNNNFVRWMDDIDFGVDSPEKAKLILKELDKLLFAKGLHLNLSKTQILSSKEARNYFLLEANRKLTVLQNLLKSKKIDGRSVDDLKIKLKDDFKLFNKLLRTGRWGKVCKRYFTLATEMKEPFLVKYVPGFLCNSPDLRTKIFKYYSELGFSKKRFNQLIDFFIGADCIDDISVLYTVKTLTEWRIPCKSIYRTKLVEIGQSIASKSQAYFIASLWLLSKYASSEKLATTLSVNKDMWNNSEIVSRQVAAVSPRILRINSASTLIQNQFTEHGQLEALRVISHLNELRKRSTFSADELSYLLPYSGASKHYPLNKFLIMLNIISNPSLQEGSKSKLLEKINERILDPIYLEHFKALS
jgi:hypothetical protein